MARLLLPRSTPLVRGLEAAAGAVLEVPTPVRDTWSPVACPVPLLPWLAWGLSLDAWATEWPEGIKRARVRNAIPISRRKGTALSVREVVSSFGGSVAIREWWQSEPKGEPHTFNLVLNLENEGAPATAAFVDQVVAEVARVKPARSHFTFTQGINGAGRVGLVAAARPVIAARLDFTA